MFKFWREGNCDDAGPEERRTLKEGKTGTEHVRGWKGLRPAFHGEEAPEKE